MKRPIAMVTGGARGIGRAIALELAKQGFDIVLNDRVESEEGHHTVNQIQTLGQKAYFCVFDVGDISLHTEKITQAQQIIGGTITTLVNNAGVSVIQRDNLLTVSEESYDRCQNINTKAVFFLCQSFIKQLLTQQKFHHQLHHSIINITSSNSHAVSTARGEYCISKAGATMITKLFASQFAHNGIGVYEIQPGLIKTKMTASVTEKYTRLAKQGLSAIDRMGEAEEIASIAVVMAKGEMAFATGQAIQADGGLHIVRY